MEQQSIYGNYIYSLENIAENLENKIKFFSDQNYENRGYKLYEHLSKRVKSEESMREKCIRKNLPQTSYSALHEIKDSIGIRIVCSFLDDIYENIENIKKLQGCKVVKEKDYIKHAKPNGYRSYHMILEVETPFKDVTGKIPGTFYAEIQLRTIAMDSWASLEHQLKYKKNIKNQDLIVNELKRCADELASCDLSMQTIRDLMSEDRKD